MCGMQEANEGKGDKLVLHVELPTFPHAVVYQQAATAPATPADMAASSDRGGPTLQLIPDPEVCYLPLHNLPCHRRLWRMCNVCILSFCKNNTSRCVLCWLQALMAPPTRKRGMAYSRDFVCTVDVTVLTGRPYCERRLLAQVGRENPSELKAAKLARGMARGVEDRDLKPNTQERQQIEAIIVGPPNR